MLRVGVRFVFEKKTHHTREFYRTTKRSSLAAGKSNLTDYTNTHHSVRVGLRDVLDRRTEVQVYFLSHTDNAASKSFRYRHRYRYCIAVPLTMPQAY